MPNWLSLNGVEVPNATPAGEEGLKLKENFVLLANRALTSVCSGRLTLVSEVPISTSDQIAKSVIYFTPFNGDELSLYDNADAYWAIHSFEELELPLKQVQAGVTTNSNDVVTGLTDTSQLVPDMEVTGAGIPAGTRILTVDSTTQITLTKNATASGAPSLTLSVPPFSLLDVFVHDGGGTLHLKMLLWAASQNTKDITAATNASPIAITSNGHGLSNGDQVGIANIPGNTAANSFVWTVANVTTNTFELVGSTGNGSSSSGGAWYKLTDTRSSASALKNGVHVLAADPSWRYLGSVMTSEVAGETEDSQKRRLVWNAQNRVRQGLVKGYSGSSTTWTYSSTTYRPADARPQERLCFVVGQPYSLCEILLLLQGEMAGGTVGVATLGKDRTDGNDGDIWTNLFAASTNNAVATQAAVIKDIPAAGYHYYQWVEKAGSSGGGVYATFAALGAGDNRQAGLSGTLDC